MCVLLLFNLHCIGIVVYSYTSGTDCVFQVISKLYVGSIGSVTSFCSMQDNKKMKRTLEEEQRAWKDLEKVVRKVLKNMNDPSWDETNL